MHRTLVDAHLPVIYFLGASSLERGGELQGSTEASFTQRIPNTGSHFYPVTHRLLSRCLLVCGSQKGLFSALHVHMRLYTCMHTHRCTCACT